MAETSIEVFIEQMILTPAEVEVLDQIRAIRKSGRPGTLVIQVKQSGPNHECRGVRVWRCGPPKDV